MTYIKLLSLSISDKLNIRIENVRIPGYVLITVIVFVSIVLVLPIIKTL